MQDTERLKKIGDRYRIEWHWGPLAFNGLFGMNGICLCFHRHIESGRPEAIVDPAKPIIPLELKHKQDVIECYIKR